MSGADHPCANGLTPECFEAYPEWAKIALAYKLLHVLIPANISRRLPKGLFPGRIGPGALLPAGWDPPPGVIVPPNYTVPPSWIPFTYFILPEGLTWADLFPDDWKVGDALPDGVTINPAATIPPGLTIEADLPPGITIDPAATIPPGWTPTNPPPEWFAPGGKGPRIPPGGALPPLYVPPQQSPPHRPSPQAPTEDIWEPWGLTICENHDWEVTNVYFPSGGSSPYVYNIYDCELGPDLALVDGILSYSFVNPATNNYGRNEHQVQCLIYLEYPETRGLIGKTKVKINFPVVEMSGTPPSEDQNPVIYVSITFIKPNGQSGTKTLQLYSRRDPSLGPGVHEALLYLGEEVRVIIARIKTRTYKNNTAIWSCDYIDFS